MKFDQRLLWTEDDDEGLEEILALARVISKICEVTMRGQPLALN